MPGHFPFPNLRKGPGIEVGVLIVNCVCLACLLENLDIMLSHSAGPSSASSQSQPSQPLSSPLLDSYPKQKARKSKHPEDYI